MKKHLIWILVILMLTLTACSKGQDNQAENQGANEEQNQAASQEVVNIAIGATSAGSSYYAYTSGIVNAVNTNPRIKAVVEEVGGTAELMSQLPLRPTEFVALGLADLAWKFYAGHEPFKQPYEDVRTWLPGPPSTIQHIVTEESGIKSVFDLPGHRYGTGPPASSTEMSTKETFELLGIEGVEYLAIPNNDAVEAVKNRQVDGLATSSPPPAALVMDMATAVQLRMLSLSDEELAKLQEKYPYYTTAVVPKGVYDFVKEDIKVPGVMATFYFHKTFDEELAYEMTKAVWENLDLVKEAHAFGEGLVMEDITEVPIPLHPGALKYYLEQGIDIPEELYPPEYQK